MYSIRVHSLICQSYLKVLENEVLFSSFSAIYLQNIQVLKALLTVSFIQKGGRRIIAVHNQNAY